MRAIAHDRSFGKPFAEPVPPDTPGYAKVIRKPMDLGTIAANLEAGSYQTLGMPAGGLPEFTLSAVPTEL